MPEKIFRPLLVLLAIFQLSISDRRIKGGLDIKSDKRYAVYLLKAADAVVKIQGWTCGGAIVSRSFVVTAAACVDDLQRIYVIAGYKKFVTSSEINKDKCTSTMKKRVIFTCVPKEYKLDYYVAEGWARIDIALVKVDSPFDFTDQQYTQRCSYQPTPIAINYWPKYQGPGTDSLTMGWGHLGEFKEDLEKNNYNVASVKYTPTKILDKKKCLSYFPLNKKMHPIIDRYMICTLEPGNLDDSGQLILRSPALHLQGCISKKDQEMGKIGRTCEGEESIIDSRRELGNNSKLNMEKNVTNLSRKYDYHLRPALTKTAVDLEALRIQENDNKKAKESPGICQNDHGGPLVTWEGRHEILIGVATLFKVDDESKCIGPYLYTSTHCTGDFLQCILSMEDDPDSGRRCENSTDQQFEIIRRHISWGEKKKDKAVKKEMIRTRPQVPIKNFYPKPIDKSLKNASRTKSSNFH